MKSKFFTLFAAMMLLFGAKVMAQTTGDVNEDGVVNEQDITAIIQIMQEAGGVKEQTKYYWYLGWDNEDWYTNTHLVTSTNGWNETSTDAMPTTYNKTNGEPYSLKGKEEDTYLVLIMPENWPVPTIYPSLKDATYGIGVEDPKSITINGVKYKLYGSYGTTGDPICYIND